MSKNKDEAKSEGYQRGIEGKGDAEGFFEGWFDDKDANTARKEGFEEGRRDRMRIDAENERKR
jgi:hypothetical protein